MTDPTGTERSVMVSRTGSSRYRATNQRGTSIEVGDGSSDDFTPVELLLVALAACTAITVDPIIERRVEPTTFDLTARADKIRDELGNHLVDVRLLVDAAFPPGEAGDRARAVLPDALRQSEQRLCTVSRTVAIGTPVEIEVRDVAGG